MTEPEIKTKLRDWILEHAKDRPAELLDDTPILEHGILSSLEVVELILFVEHLLGDEVDTDDLDADSIRDVNAIYETFFTVDA
ncbi:MAG: acyl carrier protein [bacterium]|nr:acyl carrier protein [bacterium]